MVVKLLLSASIVLGLSAQTLTLTGPSAAKPGTAVTLTLSVTGAAGATDTGMAAIQWRVALPSGFTTTVKSLVADKDVYCATDAGFCLLYGLNASVIPNGPIASYAVAIPGGITGPVSFGAVASLIGVSPAGSAMSINAGPAYTLALPMVEDLNGDGVVDSADVKLMTDMVLAAQLDRSACKVDLTSDGRCDLLDIMAILLKIPGLVK